MALRPGRYKLGPDTGTLSVRTGRGGAAAKAGHDLLIEVGAWEAEIVVGEDPAQVEMSLTADAGSLRVLEGTGGIGTLGEEERTGIRQTIDEEVLKRTPISFASTRVQASADHGPLRVEGELELFGRREPIAFELTADEAGRLSASATVKQSNWGMKPYSALFGTLKVSDEVVVSLAASL